MKSRTKVASIMLLCALMLSLVPAAVPHTQASAAASQASCDWAQFVADVTIPDGTQVQPGATFTKTWRLKNIGYCTWTTAYTMVYDSGTQMGNTVSVAMPNNVAPGQTVDLTVNLVAPSNPGSYRSYWLFKNANGLKFGIGYGASKPWWVEINVPGGGQTGGVSLDFAARAGDATWSSGAGGLTFPGTQGDAKGSVLRLDNAVFESGATASKPSLLMSPQQITNGYIQGRYPDYKVLSGDRFQATIGCQQGATACYVAYRLDYEVAGSIRTFWTFRERYEGLTYNVNLDLSPLAGQTVKFILYISAYGSPIGDQALWANPVVVSKNAPPPVTVPPATTVVPTTAIPPSSCDKAQFVADVNVPDGTVMNPSQLFTKTWRLKNIGQCAWSTSYQLVFVSGAQMGAPNSAPFTSNVAVGQTVDFSVNMTAPTASGSYRGYWMFKNANGQLFGIGTQANKPWWVDIKVSGYPVTPGTPTNTPTSTPTGGVSNSAYDFAANACSASWFSGAGGIDCAAQTANTKGYVLKVTNPKLENGTTSSQPGLLTVPQNIQDGYIQGIYPPFRVQAGDRFRSIINCQYGAANCYVGFRLDYQTGSDPIRTYWGPFRERYEGQYYQMDVDLSPLAGKDVKFILTVLALGTASGDLPLWVGPYIYRVGASAGQTYPTPQVTAAATTAVATTATTPVATTAVPTTAVATTAVATISATAGTPSSPSSSAYQNTKYNFKFSLPAGASIVSQTDNVGRVSLPLVTTGTNLQEKYILVTATEGKNPCVTTDMEGGTAIVPVTINGIQFSKQTGQGVAAGNQYDWASYATTKNNACIILTFVMHSANPGNFSTPPAVFDAAQESAVFDTVMNTFGPVSQ